MTRSVADDLRFDPATERFAREDGALLDLEHNADEDLWLTESGAVYVRNISKISDPVWVRVEGSIWSTRVDGRLTSIDWTKVSLPGPMVEAFRSAAISRLRRVTRAELAVLRSMLRDLSKVMRMHPELPQNDLGDWTPTHLTRALLAMRPTYASYMRSYYAEMVALGLPGCTEDRLDMLSTVKLRRGKETMSEVRTWDPQHGALTTAELEHLRRSLLPPDEDESDTEHFARVFLRTLVALGRRPSQLLAVAADGIGRFEKDPRLPAVIRVPGAKHQRNDRPRLYDLPDDLFDDLQRYAQRPAVQEAQGRFGHFFVTPVTAQSRASGPRDTGNTDIRLKDWIKNRGLVSPRTGKPMHITATRLRHTVATQLMRKGWDLADIREFLEHSGDNMVLAYLDAVGNDLAPALERANRALGGLFSELSGHFLGTVVSRPGGKIEKPILVPSVTNRAVIGQCGFGATCPKSPFSACLSGCPHFLFFKDADVDAARQHIAEEHERWRAAEPSAQRARAHDDFARMERGLLEAREIAEKMNE